MTAKTLIKCPTVVAIKYQKMGTAKQANKSTTATTNLHTQKLYRNLHKQNLLT
jgi:hypothetical protein